MTIIDFGPVYTSTGTHHQLDYAHKASEKHNTSLSLLTTQGILFLTEHTKEKIYKRNKNHHKLINNVVTIKQSNDFNCILNIVKRQLIKYKSMRGISGGVVQVVLRRVVGMFCRVYGMRPMDCSMLIGVVEPKEDKKEGIKEEGDKNGDKIEQEDKNEDKNEVDKKLNNTINFNSLPNNTSNSTYKLITTDPSSLTREVKAYPTGKSSSRAKTELEKLSFPMTLKEGIENGVRIMYKCFDPLRDKEFEIEMSLLNEDGLKEIVGFEGVVERYKDLNVDDE